jgi:hypothetical protein
MPWVGTEPTVPASERAKTVHALDRSATVTGHYHILPSQIWDSPNLEGQVPVFIYPRNRVAHLYPQALGSLFVASYDSQGYGEGIRPRLHTGSQLLNYSSTLYSPSRTTQKTSLPLLRVLSLPVYSAVTWQWVCMSQYISWISTSIYWILLFHILNTLLE